MQAYSSTLLQFIFKFQLVYVPYFYTDKVQKKCTNLVHSCNQMVHSYFARYSRNRKISAKNARYLPFSSDICLYLPKSHNWGGRGRKFKSCYSDQERHKKRSFSVLFSFVFSGIVLFRDLRIAKFSVLHFYTSVKDTNRQIYTFKSHRIIIIFKSIIAFCDYRLFFV